MLTEIRAADVGRIELGVPAEEPCLRMQASRIGFVIDPDISVVPISELVECVTFRSTHVSGGDDAKPSASFGEISEGTFEKAQAAPLDEGAEQIDLICGFEFTSKFVS